MSYCLLTGSTGLVGGYLLPRLLDERTRVAVLVRSTRLESATQRVDSAMRRWEEIRGHCLPRPVVLDGDLRQSGLGLDAAARQWIADHCDTILHNAASMTFREDEKTGEPFRTNVDGMRNVLALCREAGIRKFHHVSTAYICGLRTGRVRESELDLGQQNGNVYEKSKMAAEKMVLAADFLDHKTIYRPSSVVGDSQTGFTTSTHGFYLPLQMACVMAGRVPVELMGERFFTLLGLTGTEGKNLVPVDWLAEAIVYVFTRPQYHGRTYHLTSPKPVTVKLVQQIIQEAIQKHSRRRPSRAPSEEELAGYEDLFRSYMDIYRSHWRDDPTFERANTDQVLPHLPCPDLDHDTLLQIAAYPVERDFVLRQSPRPAGRVARDHLEPLVQLARRSADTPAVIVDLQVNGDGGGQWQLMLGNGQLLGATTGMGANNAARCYLNSETFTSLMHGQQTIEQSIKSGHLLIEGAGRQVQALLPILGQLVSGQSGVFVGPSADGTLP